MAVAVGDHLALLGDAEPAVDGAARLGQDGAVGRPAAAADGAAAAVEDLHGDARPAAGLRQRACARYSAQADCRKPLSLLLSE